MPFLTEFDFEKLFAKNVFNFRKSTIIDFWQVYLEKKFAAQLESNENLDFAKCSRRFFIN